MTITSHDQRAVQTRRITAADTVGFGRLVAVELRKMVDTRAARWLALATLGLAVAAATLFMVFAPAEAGRGSTSLVMLIGIGAFALEILLPVVAIVASASEWTNHVATVTYTVEPRRLRVLVATVVAEVIAALAFYLALGGLSVLIAGLGGAAGLQVDWTVTPSQVVWTGVVVVFYGLIGVTLGTMLMNTPAAIVTFFLVPTLLQIGSSMSPRFGEIARAVDVNQTFGPLIGGMPSQLNGTHLAATIGFWLVIPLAIGALRLSRREIS